MAASLISFSDLKAGRCDKNVEARLLRYWEARNVKKGGELMGVDFVLLDAKSTMIQGSITVHRLNTFKHLLNEGSIYTISGFDVTRSNPQFKLCDLSVSIRFTDLTTIVQIAESVDQIPMEMFTFRNYSQLMALANTNSELPDILGEVRMIKTSHNEHTQATEKVMVHIRLDKQNNVCLSVFDALAMQLHQKLETSGFEPKVIVATNINPKFVGGRLFLNSTSGTHFYFNQETAVSRRFYNELIQENGGQITNISKYKGVQKIENVTLAELNTYILKSSPQAIDFLCTCKVIGIITKNGWCYISCSKCSRKLQRGFSTLTCTACHDSNAVGVLRYRVEMTVSDGKDEAMFVAFDTDMTKLTNVRAADAIAGHGDSNSLPQFIQDIVGKTYTFQLKLSTYNFSAKHQSFTISRIFHDYQHPPRPTFAGQGGGGDDMPRDNMPGIAIPSSMVTVSCPTLGMPTTHAPDNNLEEGPPAQTPQNIVQTNVPSTSATDDHVAKLEPPAKKARKNKKPME